MGESIMVSRGSSSGGKEDITHGEMVITANMTFTAPITANYLVCCVGGGSSAYHYTYIYDAANEHVDVNGGRRGSLNSKTIKLNKGQSVQIKIGSGGNRSAGGTTIFGDYISANGGILAATIYNKSGRYWDNTTDSNTFDGEDGYCIPTTNNSGPYGHGGKGNHITWIGGMGGYDNFYSYSGNSGQVYIKW